MATPNHIPAYSSGPDYDVQLARFS